MISNETVFLWEKNPKEDAVLTVALPSFNSKKTIWLPYESLKNQKNINFAWELIVWEDGENTLPILKQFVGKFPGCCRIKYRYINPTSEGRKNGNLKGTFPLIDKWVGMAKVADPKSYIYVLQASDDYSPEKRLSLHYAHFKEKNCCISEQTTSVFYNLKTRRAIFYRKSIADRGKCSFLNMAVRTKCVQKIPLINKNITIDNHIFTSLEKIHKLKFADNINRIHITDSTDPSMWKTGFATDGANTISKTRQKYYTKPIPPFYSFPNLAKKLNYTKFDNYFPLEVRLFLSNFNKK